MLCNFGEQIKTDTMTFTENIELNGIGLIVSGDYESCDGDRDTQPTHIVNICSVVIADLDIEVYKCIDNDMEQRIKELLKL